MLLKASLNPKHDPKVQEIQNKLNAIKYRVHGNWPSLVPDGKFGKQTEQAVIQFQIYKNITPVSGQVGDTTFKYINEEYNYCPMLRASTEKFEAKTDFTQIIANIKDFMKDEMFGILKSIDDEAQSQIKNLSKFDDFSKRTPELQNLVNKHLRGNPTLKSLQGTIKNFWEKLERKEFLSQQAKGNTNAYNYANGKHSMSKLHQITTAQSQLSKNNKAILQLEYSAKQMFNRCVAEVQKFNIRSQIEHFSHKGQITQKGSLKGGGVLLTINLIPIISDFIIWFYSKFILKLEAKEEWDKLVKDIISFIEGVLIGAVVTAVVTAIGLTGGVAVVVVVVVCLIIGLLIALFCPEGSILEWIIKKINEMTLSPVKQ